MMKLLQVDDNEFIDEDDILEGRYHCTIDPKQVITRWATHYRGKELSIVSEERYDVPLRLGGSIAKRTALDDVMKQMREYFLLENISKLEYISVRGIY